MCMCVCVSCTCEVSVNLYIVNEEDSKHGGCFKTILLSFFTPDTALIIPDDCMVYLLYCGS